MIPINFTEEDLRVLEKLIERAKADDPVLDDFETLNAVSFWLADAIRMHGCSRHDSSTVLTLMDIDVLIREKIRAWLFNRRYTLLGSDQKMCLRTVLSDMSKDLKKKLYAELGNYALKAHSSGDVERAKTVEKVQEAIAWVLD